MNFQIYEPIKRALDVVMAYAAVLITAPLWIVAAAVIALNSPGPILFVQDRVGRHGRTFRLIKFRTMHDAVAGGANPSCAAAFVTLQRDPRVFRGGAFLRRWKIDELPQLLNVLNGTMSLVGPRPTVESDYRRMTAEQRRRSDVLPGITGLAQIRGGATIPWPLRLQWDSQYLRDRSLALDIKILAATAWMAVTGRAPGESQSADEWRDAA